MRRVVDLNAHINADVSRGNPADFPVSLQPIFHERPDGHRAVPARRAIVREDTGQAIAVVSDRYTLVPHTRILDIVERAIGPLEVGPVPRGIYVDRRGARLRALFKFPALAQPVLGRDEICPCLQVRNTYDGSSRVALHIGAFRFVCTNLAVGGAGAFAGGFVSVHAGEVPINEMADKLADYLTRFDQIVRLYRRWAEQPVNSPELAAVVGTVLNGRFVELRNRMLASVPGSVFDAYNSMTAFATHQMRSARTAFDMLERVNTSFQKTWPAVDHGALNVEARRRRLPALAES